MNAATVNGTCFTFCVHITLLWKVVEEHMKSEAEEKQILEKRRNDIQLVSSEVEMQAGRELAEARRK